MNKLSGTVVENFPFQNLFIVGDLVFYQGPLLSLFSNDKGELYLFDWSDSDDKYNRWLVFRITLNQLNQYLNKNISHYQLITTHFTDSIYSIDIDEKLNYHNIIRLNVDEIPEEYLPDKDVLHNDNECPHLDKIKSYVEQLEIKTIKVLMVKWLIKFKLPPASYDPIIYNCVKIANREQLLITI